MAAILETNGINFQQRVDRAIENIKELLIDSEIHLIDEYQNAMIIHPLKESAQAKNVNTILMLCRLHGKKSWLDMTKKDILQQCN